jgi:hypothetical protein
MSSVFGSEYHNGRVFDSSPPQKRNYEDGVHAKLADRIVAAIEADEQANRDGTSEEYRPSADYLSGYRSAMERHIEIVREVAAVPTAELRKVESR